MLMIFKKAYGDLHYATMHTDRQTNRVEKEKKKTGLRRKRKKQDWEREEKTGLQGAKFLTNESGVNWYRVIKSNCILWFLSDGYKKTPNWQNPTIFLKILYGHFDILISQKSQVKKIPAFRGCAKIVCFPSWICSVFWRLNQSEKWKVYK